MIRYLQDLVNRAIGKAGSGCAALPRGDTILKEPLELSGLRGFSIEGVTIHDSCIVADFESYEGNDPVPVIGLLNCQDTGISNLKMILTSNQYAVFGHWSKDPSLGTPTNNHYRNIVVIGKGEGFGGEANYGIVFHAKNKDDPNNEAGFFFNVHLNNCFIGWRIEGTQSKEHVIEHCRQQGGMHAVDSTGSFWWKGGGGSGLSDAAFRLREPVDTIRIDYPAFEATKRLLHASGPNGFSDDSQPIRISGGRFMCDQLHNDGAAVILEHQGPLTIDSFVFGSGQQPIPHIRANDPAQVALQAVNFESIGSFETLAAHPVRKMDGSVPTTLDNSPRLGDVGGRDWAGIRRRIR